MARNISTYQMRSNEGRLSSLHVMLKNTNALGEHINSPTVTSRIHRTRSVLTNGQITVLNPARSERARLENLVRDVWSTDSLPFPGMIMRSKSESLVRTSASSVMRKLSVASIASSLSKRSNSIKQRSRSTGYIGPDSFSVDPPELKTIQSNPKKSEEDGRNIKRRRTGLEGELIVCDKSKRHASFHELTMLSDAASKEEALTNKKSTNSSWPYTSRSLNLSRRMKHRSTRSQDYNRAKPALEGTQRGASINAVPSGDGKRATSSHSLRGLFW